MKNKLFLTESEKNTILGMHKSAIRTETKIINEAVTLQQVQQLLVDKGFELGQTGPNQDGVDGKIGPKTLQSISDALAQFAKNPAGTQTQGTTPQQDNKIHNAQVVGAPNVDVLKTTPKMMNDMIKGQPADQQQPTQIKPGMSAVGYLQDEAEGYKFTVQKVTPITECNLTELELVTQQGGRPRYGYYQGNDMESIKRFGERVKSNNPCADFASMDNFGALKFS